MMKIDITKYLWHFAPFGKKREYDETQQLNAHHVLAEIEVVGNPGSVEYMRSLHRRAISEAITEAMYVGWMPYDLEWWEGYVDDAWVLREYYDAREGDGLYHFWTRVQLLTHDTAQLKRASKDTEISIMNWRSPFPR